MKRLMKKLTYFLFLIAVLVSCKDDNQKRKAENEKAVKKKALIFNNISKAWDFYDEPINETTEESVKTWNELRSFLAELGHKPKKTIGAFQMKSAEISKKAMALNNNIPSQFTRPQIKSRISALINKVKMLDLFIHLDDIPDKKVIQLIAEINRELASLQRQMDIITEKNKIPLEQGEFEMRMMIRDTARAILNNPNYPMGSGQSAIPSSTRAIINPNDARVE